MAVQRISIFALLTAAVVVSACRSEPVKERLPRENTRALCYNGEDDDDDGFIDCADDSCAEFCVHGQENCSDRKDNDGDQLVDCLDPDCEPNAACVDLEDTLLECSDERDNDGDDEIDCADDDCREQVICGAENTDRACADRFDNDGDRKKDCEDSDCAAAAPCVASGIEADDDACADGRDNDEDGVTDCLDADCFSAGFAGCAAIEQDPLCKDDIDNDGDKLVDCEDNGCEGAAPCQAGPTEDDATLCKNGADDDGDGDIDCADVDCQRTASVSYCGTEEAEFCDDDFDNDGDGNLDCADEGCTTAPACQVDPEDTSAECTDDIDNDGDSKIDCADSDCAAHDFCAEDTLQECTDGEDNDEDGLEDCADADCEALTSICGAETTDAFCSDRIDNDGDGFVDCDDTPDCDRTGPCRGVAEGVTSPAECGDGIDNDGDGDIDCADPDCYGVGSFRCGVEDNPVNAGFCSDGADNDGDDLIDCADPECEDECSAAGNEICDNAFDDDDDGYVDCDDFDCILDWNQTLCNLRNYAVHDVQNPTVTTFPPADSPNDYQRGDNVNIPIRLLGLVVTHVQAPRDFYAADLGDTTCDATLTGCYRGMHVHASGGSMPAFSPGQLVDLAGLYIEYYGETELLAYAHRSAGGTAPTPTAQNITLAQVDADLPFTPIDEGANDRLVQSPGTGLYTDPLDDFLTAERYEGMLVTLSDSAVIANINTDAETGDIESFVLYDGTTYPFLPRVVVGNAYTQFMPGLDAPEIGDLVGGLTGVMEYHRHVLTPGTFVTEYRIQPRDATDWVVLLDSDDDGLTDTEEIALGTDPFHPDSDRDSWDDLTEVVDAAAPHDVDGDGLHDAIESFFLDRDGDDIPDEFDGVEYAGPGDDRDGDGVTNDLDEDDDNDGICDPGVAEGTNGCVYQNGVEDLCPYAPDAFSGYLSYLAWSLDLQLNADADLTDVVTPLGLDPALYGDNYDAPVWGRSGDQCDWDLDGDDVPNPADNCPFTFNLQQTDTDSDGWGNACDDDLAPVAPIQCEMFPEWTGESYDATALGGLSLCDLQIEEVMFNLPGSGAVSDTNRDGTGQYQQDEFVEIRNVSDRDLNISGLEIWDEASLIVGNGVDARHVVPAGTILRRNQRLVVFGGGTPMLFPSDVIVQVASSGSLGFNNGDDLVILVWPPPLVGAYPTTLAHLAYGLSGEPDSGSNTSITRYPDGIPSWRQHSERTYIHTNPATLLSASPGQAPDNRFP